MSKKKPKSSKPKILRACKAPGYDPIHHVLGTRAAAKVAGVSEREIRRRQGLGEIRMAKIAGGKNLYFRVDLMQSGSDDMRAVRDKDTIAGAGIKETKQALLVLELAEKEGKFVVRDEVERRNVEKIIAVKRAMLGMGRKLAPRLINRGRQAEIKKMIDEEVKAIINGFAGPL